MKNLAQSIWWWTRATVFALLTLYAVTLLWNNSRPNEPVRLWYWPGQPVEETSIIALAVMSFLLGAATGVTGWALIATTVKYRRTREQRRRRVASEQREAMTQKAARLRIKPPPEPIVRGRPRDLPKDPIPYEPPVEEVEPIIVNVPRPELTSPHRTPFSRGAVPVVVNESIVMTPLPDPEPAVERTSTLFAEKPNAHASSAPVNSAASDEFPSSDAHSSTTDESSDAQPPRRG